MEGTGYGLGTINNHRADRHGSGDASSGRIFGEPASNTAQGFGKRLCVRARK